MNNEQQLGKDMEESRCDNIWGIMVPFARGTERKEYEISVRITKMWTLVIQNTKNNF
jgi:hypothetical protein